MSGQISASNDLFSSPFTCISARAVGDWVYLSATDTVALCDGTNVAKMPAIGVIVEKPTSTTCIVQYGGEVTKTGLVALTAYYVSSTGQLTTTPPSVPQQVGVARNTTTLVMSPTVVIGGTVTGNIAATGSVTAGTDLIAGSAAGGAGELDIFPVTGANGKTSLTASNNAGNTITNINTAAQAGARTYTVPDAGGATASFALLTSGQGTAGVLSRTDLGQEANSIYPIAMTEFRTLADLRVPPPNAGGASGLGLIDNSFGTGSPTLETEDLKAVGVTTRTTRFQFPVPKEYVAGQAVTVSIKCGMKTTVADTTATINALVYRQAAPSANIVAGAAQSINSLTPAVIAVTVTPTAVVPGDLLDIEIVVVVTDGATGTAVIGQVSRVQVLLSTKG